MTTTLSASLPSAIAAISSLNPKGETNQRLTKVKHNIKSIYVFIIVWEEECKEITGV